MPNPTRAGSRTPRFRPGFGRISDRTVAWLRTRLHFTQIVVQALDPLEHDEENGITELSSEPGKSYILLIPVQGRKKPVIWNFSALTTDELQATRDFFNHLFDLADPVVRERDKVAADAHAKGDYSFQRNYRDVPQFVTREGSSGTDGEGVHSGSSRLVNRTRITGSTGRGVRADGDELVDGQPQQGISEDDGPTPDGT